MTAVLLILKSVGGFIGENWKAALVVAVIVVVGGYVASLKVTIAAKDKRIAALERNIELKNELIAAYDEANTEWQAAGEEWTKATADLLADVERYRANYEAERARRLAALQDLADVEAELQEQITSDDCETAVDQLLGALDWSDQ